MPLQLEENIQPLPEDFDWGKSWKATRIWKEKRDDGEFLYAFLIKYFGPNDYGNKREDELWIGREIEYIKGREWQNNPKKPNYGKRVDVEADEVTESIWDPDKGKYVEEKTPVNAKKTYKYLHNASNKDLIAKYKTLIGDIPSGRTKLYFLYNDRLVLIENQDDFFNHSVDDLSKIERETDSLFKKPKDRAAKGQSHEDI